MAILKNKNEGEKLSEKCALVYTRTKARLID
jgi:hypothetical protein